ncbi:hypothetical protein ACFSQT_11490 [Mesorhizobium calcicola]|uniref:Acetophenone carboxylase-like C-terminal domain-containing protein n=1 Tax=Mesorhizobium calcicola TaxID=1300310 RepID=A0ABW4WAX1_9HYPH
MKKHFEGKGFVDCAVFDRSKLAAGATIAGPAIIEERESTIVAGPNTFINVDDHFNVVIEIRETE